MKTVLCLFALVAMVVCRPETYDLKFENFNAKEVAENVRLLKGYGNCFLGEGPCTAEGNDFKELIPDGIKTNCAKCTPKQREHIRTVVRGFQEKLPDMWASITKKEDPKGEYKEKFEKFLKADD